MFYTGFGLDTLHCITSSRLWTYYGN